MRRFFKGVEGDDDGNSKRPKQIENCENDEECNKATANEENKTNQKPPEPLKDYIHVRARRGQATDSHSLAERVKNNAHFFFTSIFKILTEAGK